MNIFVVRRGCPSPSVNCSITGLGQMSDLQERRWDSICRKLNLCRKHIAIKTDRHTLFVGELLGVSGPCGRGLINRSAQPITHSMLLCVWKAAMLENRAGSIA